MIVNIISFLALIISALSYIKARQSLDYKKKNEREKFIISSSKPYVDLYNDEILKIKKA